MKYLMMIFFLFGIQTCIYSNNLDSLYQVWEDEFQADTIRAEALFNYYSYAQGSMDIDSSIIVLKELEQFAKKNNLLYWEGVSLTHQSTFSSNSGKIKEGVSLNEQAIALFEEIGAIDDIYRAKLNLGIQFLNLGKYEIAKSNIEDCLPYYNTKNKWDMVFMSNRLISYYFSIKNQPKIAIEWQQKNTEIVDKLNDFPDFQAQAYSDLADSYEKNKNYDEAAVHFRENVRIYEENEMYSKTSNSLYNLVTNELSRNNSRAEKLKEYETIILRNLAKIPEKSDDINLVMAYLALSKVYEYFKDFEKAEDASLKAINITEDTDFIHFEKVSFIRAGLLAMEMEEFKKAADYCQKAFELTDIKADYANTEIICDCLVRSYSVIGESNKVVKYYPLYKEAKDSLSNIDKVRQRTTILLENEFNQERKEAEFRQQVEIAEQKSIQAGLAIGLSALAILAFFIFRSNRNKAKANSLLKIKNEQILEQNQQISEQKEALKKSNYTKDRIFAIIGHDMRKPAIAFRGIARKVNYLLEKKDYALLEKLGESIERDTLGLNNLIDNLLNWALTQKNALPHQPEQIQLSEVIRDVFMTLGRLAEDKGISLKSEIPNDTMIMADRNSLLTIIRNLVDNAIKFTSKDGKIIITSKPSDVGIDVSIKDTGMGMDIEKTKSIFLLQQGKSTQGTIGEKGTGLGLYLVHELVKLNEGDISVASKLGKGTEFCISLKVA